MDRREEVCVMNRDRQEDILAVCRRDGVRRYRNEEDVGEGRRSVAYGGGTEDGWRTPSEDKEEHEQCTYTVVKEDEGGSLHRDEPRAFEEGELGTPKTRAGEDHQSTLKAYDKEDDICTPKGEPRAFRINCEEGELGTPKTRAGEDDQSTLKAYDREDDISTPKGELRAFRINCEEGELGTPKIRAGEDDQSTLKAYDKEDDISTPKGDDKEDGHSMLGIHGKDSMLGIHGKDDEHNTLGTSEREVEWNKSGKDENNYSLEIHEKEDERDMSSSCEKDDGRVSPSNEAKRNEQSVRKSEMVEETGQQGQSSSILGAVKVAGEVFQNVYFSGPVLPQSPPQGHRRAQSEIGTPGHRRTNSFQRLKTQMQKAWRGVSNLREESRPCFNPEVLANQKRQWYQLHSSKALGQTKYKEPTSLFEHFIIVGLHPETNLEAVEEAFRKRKKWEMEMSRYEVADHRILRHRGPQLPTLEPQILFRYPPGKKLAMLPKDLATFCFPGGVKARLLERTPSLSDLNEVVYGQEHRSTDDSTFIFSFKVADDATLYGVCLHVSEIVQRPPGVLSTSSPLHSCEGSSRFLVSAPRCYCLLTRVPCFELHFEMLNSMIAQERLKRITEFVSEMSLTTSCYAPSVSRPNDQTNGSIDSPGRDHNDWMAFAIPVDSAVALTAAAAGFISDNDIAASSQKIVEPSSPESVVSSDSSEASHTKEIERDERKGSPCYDDNSSEASETYSETPEKMYKGYENSYTSPQVMLSDSRIRPIERIESSNSVFSSVRNMLSDEVDDCNLSNSENDFGDDLIMEWARDHKNDSLQIICGYHSLAIPSRGSKLAFQPLDHLQEIEFTRPPVSALGLSEYCLNSCNASEVNVRLAAAEEALALSTWTTATICRVLSLETIMALLAGVLLEKQVVVVCPNLGILSATVMSLIPMIQPFQWQSLLLPVLPGRMFDFLEAPVPFLVGIHSQPADWKIKTSNLILVNVLHNQVKTCDLPMLPRRRELMAQLSPIHATLANQSSAARRNPVNKCNEVQAEAARKFLTVMKQYMESLCADLQFHTITSVQSNNDRVSLLLKDSFIDSFPGRDRPFIKLFVDTQLFSVLSDHRLSSFENGHH